MEAPFNPGSAPAHLQLIVQELGPASADVDSVVQQDDSWIVTLENGRTVHLCWREEPPRLELMAPFSKLPDEASLEAHRVLLMFNFLSVDNGGCRMGLSAVDDLLLLIRDLPEAHLSLQTIQSAIRSIVDLGSKWDSVLQWLTDADQTGPRMPAEQFA